MFCEPKAIVVAMAPGTGDERDRQRQQQAVALLGALLPLLFALGLRRSAAVQHLETHCGDDQTADRAEHVKVDTHRLEQLLAGHGGHGEDDRHVKRHFERGRGATLGPVGQDLIEEQQLNRVERRGDDEQANRHPDDKLGVDLHEARY